MKTVTIYLDIAEHVMQIMWFATQGQMIEDILIHQLDMRVTKANSSISVPVKNK